MSKLWEVTPMAGNSEKSLSMFGVFWNMLAIPCNWVMGFIVGLVAPVAAIAAMIAGIRLFTGKVPFLGQVWDTEEGGRQLAFKLVPPEQVGEMFAQQKDEIGGDIAKMQAEIKAIIEETKEQAQAEAEE
jgi:hypothetical protein